MGSIPVAGAKKGTGTQVPVFLFALATLSNPSSKLCFELGAHFCQSQRVAC